MKVINSNSGSTNAGAVGILGINPKGKIHAANPQICDLLGYSARELKTHTLESLFADTADALPASPRPQAVSTLKQSKSAVARYAERGWDIRVESLRETGNGNRPKVNRGKPGYTYGREAGRYTRRLCRNR